MAFLCLRFIGAVPVSIITEERHESELSLTKLPVEFGADITDHAYVEPKKVKVKGMIGVGTGGLVGSFISAAGYQALLTYQRKREPFTFVSGLNVYTNMLIKKISAPVDTDNSGTLEFDIDLEEVILVGSGFGGSQIGAISVGQAVMLTASVLAAGSARNRASPSVRRGDNVIREANTDTSTHEGRRNTAAAARVA